MKFFLLIGHDAAFRHNDTIGVYSDIESARSAAYEFYHTEECMYTAFFVVEKSLDAPASYVEPERIMLWTTFTNSTTSDATV